MADKRGRRQGNMIPKCDICGCEEEHPVANEYKGRIEWICWKCYQVKKKRSKHGKN